MVLQSVQVANAPVCLQVTQIVPNNGKSEGGWIWDEALVETGHAANEGLDLMFGNDGFPTGRSHPGASSGVLKESD